MNVRWEHLPQAEWEEFHALHHGALQQAWAYGEALTSLGVKRMVSAMVTSMVRVTALAWPGWPMEAVPCPPA